MRHERAHSPRRESSRPSTARRVVTTVIVNAGLAHFWKRFSGSMNPRSSRGRKKHWVGRVGGGTGASAIQGCTKHADQGHVNQRQYKISR